MQIQPKVKGRKRLSAGVIREIRQRVESIAHQHDVSMSFVISVALAEAFHIKLGDHYETYTKKSRSTSS